MIKIQIYLILCLSFSFSALSAKNYKNPNRKKIENNSSYVSEYLYKGKNLKLVPPDHPIYQYLANEKDNIFDYAAKEKVTNLKGYKNKTYFFIYSELGPESGFIPDLSIFSANLNGESDTSIVIALKLKEQYLSEKYFTALSYFLAHKVSRIVFNFEKLIYLQEPGAQFHLQPNNIINQDSKYTPFLAALKATGYNPTANLHSFSIYRSEFKRILAQVMRKFLSPYEFSQLVASYPDSLKNLYRRYDLRTGDFYFENGDENLVVEARNIERSIWQQTPILKNLGFQGLSFPYLDFHNKPSNIDLYSLFKIEELTERYGEEQVASMNLYELAVEAEFYYLDYLKKNKKKVDELWPKLRIYSAETMADDFAFFYMQSQNHNPSSYLKSLGELLSARKFDSLEPLNICFDVFLNKNLEPGMGNPGNEHPSFCWRLFRLKQREKQKTSEKPWKLMQSY